MSEIPRSPSWVDALAKAEVALDAADNGDLSPEDRDSQVRLAYGWMDIAKLYKG